MDTYKVFVKFKDGRQLTIDMESEENPRKNFQKEWKTYRDEGAIAIGKHIIATSEILYIEVRGTEVEKKIPIQE